jgi:hypothetical protein
MLSAHPWPNLTAGDNFQEKRITGVGRKKGEEGCDTLLAFSQDDWSYNLIISV